MLKQNFGLSNKEHYAWYVMVFSGVVNSPPRNAVHISKIEEL